MPGTIKIQDTLNWVAAFIVQRPTTGVNNIANEPGLTTAAKIIQTITAAPFKWAWNRAEASLTCTAPANNVGVTDYQKNLADFGFLEKATISGGGLNGPVEIEVYQILAQDVNPDQVQKIAPILDDSGGNITFRLMPAPLQAYTVTLTYQKAPQLPAGVNDFWTPIPDKYAFLYEQAMLAHLQGMYSPQLYLANMELFFRQLVGAAEGLSETEKNIFLEDKLRDLRTEANAVIGARRAKESRG